MCVSVCVNLVCCISECVCVHVSILRRTVRDSWLWRTCWRMCISLHLISEIMFTGTTGENQISSLEDQG